MPGNSYTFHHFISSIKNSKFGSFTRTLSEALHHPKMKIEHSTLLIHKSKLTCQSVQSFLHIIKCGTRYYIFIYIYAFILQYMLSHTITNPPSVHWAPQNSLKVTETVGDFIDLLEMNTPLKFNMEPGIFSPWKRRLQLETMVFQGGIPPVMSYCMAILPPRQRSLIPRGEKENHLQTCILGGMC